MKEVLKWFEDNIYYSVGSGNVSFSIHNGDLWEFEGLLKEQDKQLDELEEEIERLNNIINKAIEYIETCNPNVDLNSMFLNENYISNYGAKELLNILRGED